jgi:hypothetical protein
MKFIIAKSCVFILRKLKFSAIIGYEINGGSVKCMNYSGLLYDNEFNQVDYRVIDGSKFEIPPGKFSVSFPAKEVSECENEQLQP